MKKNKTVASTVSQTDTRVNLISRRRWLQSAMASFAMPSLEIFSMGKAHAQQVKPNFLVYYLPNGRKREWFYPSFSGGKITFPSDNSPLQPWADRMAIGSLDNSAAKKSTPGAAHAKGASTVLTCSANDMKKVTNHISIDQIIANEIGNESRFKSLHYTSAKAGTHPERCDVSGTACIYTKSVSWQGLGKPNTPVTSLDSAFKQLFGDGQPAPVVPSGPNSLKSVLDVLTAESKNLKNALGKADQLRLEQYFEGLRDVERRIQQGSVQCDTDDFSVPKASDYGRHVDAFHDLMILALSCGQTKVITYMLDYELSNRRYDFLDINIAYHNLTHRDGDDNLAKYRRIEKWQAPKLASFFKKMEDTIGAGGNSLLDETVVLMTPGMGSGNSHDHGNVSPILMGGTNSPLKTDGRSFPKQELANLYVTLLDAYGIEGNFGRDGARFGDNGKNAIKELL